LEDDPPQAFYQDSFDGGNNINNNHAIIFQWGMEMEDYPKKLVWPVFKHKQPAAATTTVVLSWAYATILETICCQCQPISWGM